MLHKLKVRGAVGEAASPRSIPSSHTMENREWKKGKLNCRGMDSGESFGWWDPNIHPGPFSRDTPQGPSHHVVRLTLAALIPSLHTLYSAMVTVAKPN